jgi:putative ABC transport system permease protein
MKSILRRKQKNLITALAIALGVALFIGAQAGSDGVVQTVAKIELNNSGNTDIIIFDTTSQLQNGLFNESMIDLIDTSLPKLKDIKTVAKRINFGSTVFAIESKQLEKDVIIRGITPSDDGFGTFYDLENKEIQIETVLTSNKVIVSSKLADEMLVEEGDIIQIGAPTGLGNTTILELTVANVYDDSKDRGKEGATAGTVSQLYINIDTLQQEQEFPDFITGIAITFDESVVDRSLANYDVNGKTFPGIDVIKDAREELEELFEDDFPGAFVWSQRVSDVESLAEDIAGLTSILTIFAVILNITALLLIINVQSMAVDDIKNQTAVLRAIGSCTRSILTVFLFEAFLVGIFGALIGFGLGYLISFWFLALLTDVFGVELSGVGLDPALVIIAIVLGVILSIITAVVPSMRASKQSVENALRGISDPEVEKRGKATLVFGVIFLPLGMMFASQVGNVFDKATYEVFEDQVTIILGFGLTLAGLGMLLTLILSRRLALSISGISLWGLGVIALMVFMQWGKEGDGGTWLTIVLLFVIAGSSLLVSQNYEFLMNGISKFLFFFAGLMAISQVTTKQMIGKKSRGVLVFTILSIILVLTIFITSAAETQRVGAVDLYDELSDGVDIIVSVDDPATNVEADLIAVDDSITEVFSFRRTYMPVFLQPASNENFDPSEDFLYLPVVEVPENILNPSGQWGETDLKLRFDSLSGEIKESTGHSINVKTSDSEHEQITEDIFDTFYGNHDTAADFRTQKVVHDFKDVFEEQQMVISGFALDFINLDLVAGASLYLQTTSNEYEPVFIGATTYFDMMGSSNFPLFGDALLVTPSMAAQLPFTSENPNLFLVRSSNEYADTKANEQLANDIETALNNPGVVFYGAATTIIREEVQDFWFQNAAFWDFLAAFSTLGLVIGALGMMIIAVRSVSERRREIGMMRSIGFSRNSVVLGVLIEMLSISLLGLIIGMINAILFTEGFASNILGIKATYPIFTLFAYIFGVILLGVLAAVIPGYNASKVTPSQALRYTG